MPVVGVEALGTELVEQVVLVAAVRVEGIQDKVLE
jgi:hypothetical protein